MKMRATTRLISSVRRERKKQHHKTSAVRCKKQAFLHAKNRCSGRNSHLFVPSSAGCQQKKVWVRTSNPTRLVSEGDPQHKACVRQNHPDLEFGHRSLLCGQTYNTIDKAHAARAPTREQKRLTTSLLIHRTPEICVVGFSQWPLRSVGLPHMLQRN